MKGQSHDPGCYDPARCFCPVRSCGHCQDIGALCTVHEDVRAGAPTLDLPGGAR